MRHRVNLFRYYCLCLMSMNWLSTNWPSTNWLSTNWLSTNWLSTNWLFTNWLFTNWLCEHPRARQRPRVVYPVFCSNADGSRRVNVLTRTEPAGQAFNSYRLGWG